MNLIKPLAALGAAVAIVLPAPAQHAQVSCVGFRPSTPNEAWTCNRDNDSVAVVNLSSNSTVAEVAVGVNPRSLAFSADGSKVFVACQRGNVPMNKNFVTPFDGSEIRGQVYVIDAATRTVTGTLDDVGVEPYGVAVAPNGKYFAVTGFRSGTVKFYDVQTLALLATHEYLDNFNFIPPPFTVADVDENRDGIADLGDPRGFTIKSDSQKLYVTHHKSPYVSVLDVTLDGNGLPTAVALGAKVDTNEYAFDPFYNPTPVQILKSQGTPRFLEDIALSPDGTRALVPHVLHNINHDVNFNFGPSLTGAFANRVYPALTMVDTVQNSYAQLGDASARLHNELSDPLAPAEFYPTSSQTQNGGGIAMLGGKGSPTIGGSFTLTVDGIQPGQYARIWVGKAVNVPMGSIGTKVVNPRFVYTPLGNGNMIFLVPNIPSLDGVVVHAQAAYYNSSTNQLERLSNGLDIIVGTQGYGAGKMGHRAGQPSRVVYSPDGGYALMLNRGSEDLFMYRVIGSQMTLGTVYPPRAPVVFQPRAPLDTTTALGDLPLGMALQMDAASSNPNDGTLLVMNEATRTLSKLRVNFHTQIILREGPQISTVLGPDKFSASVRLGLEIFEDASRPATAGNFNNSCGSCHFEGGEDSNVWQRPDGPRSTMPVYGGTLLTGLILWKGSRLNMGETGPMFGGENGGHGLFSDAEQQALIDYHETIPVPLNPNFGPNGQYTALAAIGKDLFFGSNDSGTNPTGRHAGCAGCHPDQDSFSSDKRGYTADFLDPTLTMGENLEAFDPFCITLQENLIALNVRNVNSGCDIDFDQDTFPDPDRNADGFNDPETYPVMNADTDADFFRDDPNSYDCPIDPQDPPQGLKLFTRDMRQFSIPTKLGVFSSGPYFHDHSAYSLRTIVDPAAQAIDPVYGSPAYGIGPAYPGLLKFFNEFHDVRGHEDFQQGASKVQITLNSVDPNADIEAILAYIQTL